MENQENKPSSTPLPKRDIPDIWAANGRCPACGATGLKVTHLPDMADYLSCVKCEISFEVENGGRYIRLKYIPDALEFVDAILHNRWVEASKLSAIISEKRPSVQEKKVPPLPPPSEFSEEEVWSRALGMYRMGNKPKMIQLMLIQSGMMQEQADAVFVKLKKVAEQNAQRQTQKFWTMAGISFFLIVLVACSWVYISGNLPILLGITTVTPSSLADKPSTIDKILDLVPDEAKPDLMNLPDVKVDNKKGPGKAACPATPDVAAQLFGGDATLWKRDDSQFPSWQMISVNDSVTVSVPDGMTAGYVDNKSFTLLSVHGPATIYNANFLVITCD